MLWYATSLLCSEEINLTGVSTSGCDAICLVVGHVLITMFSQHIKTLVCGSVKIFKLEWLATVQEANVLQSRCYHCIILYIHKHEESLSKGPCVIFAPISHADFALRLWKNNRRQFGISRFHLIYCTLFLYTLQKLVDLHNFQMFF